MFLTCRFSFISTFPYEKTLWDFNGENSTGCIGWRAKTHLNKGRLNLMPKKLRLFTHVQKLRCSHPAAILFSLVPILKLPRSIHRSLRPLSFCGLSRRGFKTPLGLNFCVGLWRLILEIFPIFLWLAAPVPRSCPADLGWETLNPIEGFETTSGESGKAEVMICN